MPMFFVLVVILLNSFTSSSSTTQYNVLDYGAKPNGETESTKAFLTAWENACGSSSPATLYVPSGRFLLRTIVFKGPCQNKDILVSIDGTIVAPSDYKIIGEDAYWILFENVEGVSVSGGILDARGSSLWACKASTKTNCPTGARTIGFSDSRNIEISGLTSLNSQLFHIVIEGCHNVKVSGVKVSAPDNSPNTDGIHVQLSLGVTISNSRIATGDDCISIGPGASNIWIESIACGPGHGISIGSLGQKHEEPGVQNVTVTSVTFTGTQNGVRIKFWGRPSSGFARNILFQHATMNNVDNPILIDQNYCPHDQDCPGQASGVKISDVTYQDIHGTSATEMAVKLLCSKKYPCTGIKLEDVKLTYKNQPANAFCNNADGTASGFLQPSSCL